jgi:quercetin 2,3-dioxygenase
MIRIRKAEERGHTKIDWLDSYHTFSFGEYYDPDNMGFESLRVINDDRIKPSMGFGSHPHRDMEIMTYMIEGELIHKDSMGNGSVIKKGDIQKMTAGRGIIHSEYNNSDSQEAHLLQIWITPDRKGLTPSYEQLNIKDLDNSTPLKLMASGSADNQDGIIKINQKVNIYIGSLSEGEQIVFNPDKSGSLWIQIVKGKIIINEQMLAPGDGANMPESDKLDIRSLDNSEFLIFDMQ